jgi:hypothetical protein
MPNIVEIPLKGGVNFPVDLDEILGEDFPGISYQKIIVEGLKVVLKAKTEKQVVKDKEGEELAEAQAAIRAIAEENLQDLREGNVKATRKAAKIPGAVRTKAVQNAKAKVKVAIKKAGYKLSSFKAKEITEMANQYLEEHPELIEQAVKELTAQEQDAGDIALPESFTDGKEKVKPRGKPTAALAAAARKRGEVRLARGH